MRKRNAVKKIAAVLASACLIVSMLATTVMAKPGRIHENRKSDCDSIFRRFERLYI